MDIEKYIDDEHMREIAQKAFYDEMRSRFNGKNQDHILWFVTQEYVRQLIAEVLGDDYKKLIAEKVCDAINSLDSWVVFREADSYSRESIARRFLNEAMLASKEKIFDRLNAVIDDKDARYFESVIKDAAADFISENLFKKSGD